MSGAVVSFMKSSGGVGATSLAVQMACAKRDEELALLDLDIQFGAAAFQMDVSSDASIIDLVSVPDRLDPAMVKGAMVRPHERFDLLAAPQGMHPIDVLTADGVIRVIDVARESYSAVLLDLPEVWTEWSYAALAHSSRIVLVLRLTIPSLRQARRQIDMIKQENLGHIPLYVIANQVAGGILGRSLSKREGEAVLGRPIDFTVSSDDAIQMASDSGLPLAEVPGGGAHARKLAKIIEQVLASRSHEEDA